MEPGSLGLLCALSILRARSWSRMFERLIRSGAASSYADVAAMVKQTTARLSQLAMLLNLAPDLQAEILDLTAPEKRGVLIDEKEVRRIANEVDWSVQREAWRKILTQGGSISSGSAEPPP